VTEQRTTWGLIRYFLYLGSVGFGGPAALLGYMQRDLVERRGWFTKDEYTRVWRCLNWRRVPLPPSSRSASATATAGSGAPPRSAWPLSFRHSS
jgi:hypothetical protein